MDRAVGTRDGGTVANHALDHAAHPSQRRPSIEIVRGAHAPAPPLARLLPLAPPAIPRHAPVLCVWRTVADWRHAYFLENLFRDCLEILDRLQTGVCESAKASQEGLVSSSCTISGIHDREFL